MSELRYFLWDVFCDTPFAGNPLAVVIDPPPLGSDLMATIAREFNLSETIFLSPTGPGRWRTRIFTPAKELPFAGHPTVGGALALAERGLLGHGDDLAVTLEEVAGDVAVVVRRDANGAVATFTAPASPTLVTSPEPVVVDRLLAAVSLGPDDAHPALAPGVWHAGIPIAVVPVASIEALGRARPDAGALGALEAAGVPAEVYLLAPDPSDATRWRARMFAPGSGITEDPATGSAACAAAGLLATVARDGDAEWRLDQGVEMGRPSVLRLAATVRDRVAVDARLGGGAVLVGEGVLHLPD